ncbi:hypothetical protein BC628DRAFT_188769 [Trametes gibbosa]|nr:hypothetical protein BC628DRAFT_188769 [Trametes gibbosa]
MEHERAGKTSRRRKAERRRAWADEEKSVLIAGEAEETGVWRATQRGIWEFPIWARRLSAPLWWSRPALLRRVQTPRAPSPPLPTPVLSSSPYIPPPAHWSLSGSSSGLPLTQRPGTIRSQRWPTKVSRMSVSHILTHSHLKRVRALHANALR